MNCFAFVTTFVSSVQEDTQEQVTFGRSWRLPHSDLDHLYENLFYDSSLKERVRLLVLYDLHMYIHYICASRGQGFLCMFICLLMRYIHTYIRMYIRCSDLCTAYAMWLFVRGAGSVRGGDGGLRGSFVAV